MKYYARVDDREFEIEIQEGEVQIDGEVVDIDLAQGGVPELYSLLMDGSSYEILIEDRKQDYAVTLRGDQFRVQVEDERSRRLNRGRTGPSLPQGELTIRAPIPGLVVKVLVSDGEEIDDGQPLLILEAMKMENEIRAPRAGTVRRLDISAGQRVEQNAALMVIT